MSQRTPGPRTLGPVDDLERHLPSDWWRTLFSAMYLKTDGDVVENADNTQAEIDALMGWVDLQPDERILDLCCGQGRHTLELARRGFQGVVGLDRSRTLIRIARNRARKEGLTVRFHEGDARRFRLPRDSFDCVLILGNSFGYFEREEDDLEVLRSVSRVLRPGGRLALDLAEGNWLRENFERRSWEWIDQQHFVCRERSLAADGRRLISREVVVHAERGVIVDQFYAERLYDAEAIQELLERAGFEDVEVRAGTDTQSDRNQDLGMMAHRILVRARTSLEASKRKREVPFPRVTVLLGDPSLPDPVKREGCFSAEDLDTVARLKSALGELSEYRFEFVDRHEGLLEALSAKPPSFVLNLCDEGYRNDAFQELHVPALLELLGVPYSGAGPSALGLCYDKSLVAAIARSLDIPVPDETFVDPADGAATLPALFPALVKPATGDSSIGIDKHAVVADAESLIARIHELGQQLPGIPLLVQEFLTGTEYTVGVVGNPGLGHEVLPILEVDYGQLDPGLPPILSYESKWEPDSPYWTKIQYVESQVPQETRNALIDHSLKLFQRLGCRDYARFDFRADARARVKLLEVNPNPGWCWDGKMNLMAEMAGFSYAELLRRILATAQDRASAERSRRKRALSAAA
jgi:D-alanine-D-alanine ligase